VTSTLLFSLDLLATYHIAYAFCMDTRLTVNYIML